MFLPTTRKEMSDLGWEVLDVILVSGDSYIDTPFNGAAVIGKVLARAGFRVGIIAQPDVKSEIDITRLGEPELFWGVTAGVVDSMVANYTAAKKKRRSDDNTPGGLNDRRPDRASIVYANLIRRYFKKTRPIILGGIEASLRRMAHYDFWTDKVRGAVLVDAKADYLCYGMGEKTILQFADALKQDGDPTSIRGLSYRGSTIPEEYIELPSLEAVTSSKDTFIDFFNTFYQNNDPITAKGLAQKHGSQYVIQNPPMALPTETEMDSYYSIPFERAQHPYYEKQGKVKSLETIQFAIQTHRGCYGECNFCAIAVHEGRTIASRSAESIIAEARSFTEHPQFKGIIHDVGGPTANMYGFECRKKLRLGACKDLRCLFPEKCKALPVSHKEQIDLLNEIRKIPGVKKVFIGSGIRYDMVLDDKQHGEQYLRTVVNHHVSGQLKIAPEHVAPSVLQSMGKPGGSTLLRFKDKFDRFSKEAGKNQFLTYYFIAAHPGCSDREMDTLKDFISQELKLHPEQVQVFTPTPSTYSTLMYYTEKDPFTKKPIFVEKDLVRKDRQKSKVVRRSALVEPQKASRRRA